MTFVKAGTQPKTKREQVFVLVEYGSPGMGKSTLGQSAPEPVTFDFDDGMHRVAANHRGNYIIIEKYEDALQALQLPEVQEAKSIVIDTGGALINYLKDYVMRTKPGTQLSNGDFNGLKGFGYVKSEFESLVHRIKNLMHMNLIIIFHSNEVTMRDGTTAVRLQCEGSAKNIVWNMADFGGFMQMSGGKRTITFTPSDEFFAKGCHGISGTYSLPELGENDKNEFLSKLFEKARQNIEQENITSNEKRTAYDAVMDEVKAMVDAVDDADSATAAAHELPNLPHALTSKAEASAMLAKKASSLGLVWDRQIKRYINASYEAGGDK